MSKVLQFVDRDLYTSVKVHGQTVGHIYRSARGGWFYSAHNTKSAGLPDSLRPMHPPASGYPGRREEVKEWIRAQLRIGGIAT